MLLRYGQLKSFYLVKDTAKGIAASHHDTPQSKGYAFCEYVNEQGVHNALKYLNGVKIGQNQFITIRKNQSNSYIVGLGAMTESEKIVFTAKCDEIIETTSQLLNKAAQDGTLMGNNSFKA